jgi:hypothetical protein
VYWSEEISHYPRLEEPAEFNAGVSDRDNATIADDEFLCDSFEEPAGSNARVSGRDKAIVELGPEFNAGVSDGDDTTIAEDEFPYDFSDGGGTKRFCSWCTRSSALSHAQSTRRPSDSNCPSRLPAREHYASGGV